MPRSCRRRRTRCRTAGSTKSKPPRNRYSVGRRSSERTQMPHVVSIAYTRRDVERRPTDHYARVPAERATLVEQRGIKGDVKGSGGSRQLNVMRAETLAELAAEGRKTGPGEMGEQIVIAGLDPATFTEGTQLQLGSE